MTDTVVEQDAVLDYAVLDKRIRVGPGAQIGGGARPAIEGAARPGRFLTVIGKNTQIPASTHIGRCCTIAADLTESAFDTRQIPDGTSVGNVGE
jgi:glucose-1-phosphate adenylyltransferase